MTIANGESGASVRTKLNNILSAADVTAVSMFPGNDLRDGSAGWNLSGWTTNSYGAEGVTLTAVYASGGTSFTGRIFKSAAGGGLSLVAGHKYACFVDVSLEDIGSSGASTVSWRPFVLSSTPGLATTGKRVAIGATGSPIRHRLVTSFIETSTSLKGNPYSEMLLVRNASGTNMAAYSLRVIYHSFMVVDLGVEGDQLFDLTESEVAILLRQWDAPYHPSPGGLVSKALYAAKSTKADTAGAATTSETADLAAMAETLRSPWEDKRILTIGHSLVSQQNWQGTLVGMLSLEGYSVQGTAGGTLQPRPADSVAGMFSRSAMSSMVANLINLNDADVGGASSTGLTTSIAERTAATIFWTGANDTLMDLSNTAYQSLAQNREKIASLEARAIALSQGHYADTAAGLAATTNEQYFTVNGDVTGFRVLYRHLIAGVSVARAVYHYPHAGQAFDTDRIMTTAEQNEFEARNTADGSAAFLSEPLTNGFIVTYEALWHTMIANYLAATGFDEVPEHRFFIVREPQAFWRYDGTYDWPQGYYEKNETHRRVADRWGIPLVDLWADSNINISTRGWFIQNEAAGDLFIHINDKGGRQVANVFRNRMLQNPPLDFTADTDGAFTALPTVAGDLGPWNADNVVST